MIQSTLFSIPFPLLPNLLFDAETICINNGNGQLSLSNLASGQSFSALLYPNQIIIRLYRPLAVFLYSSELAKRFIMSFIIRCLFLFFPQVLF